MNRDTRRAVKAAVKRYCSTVESATEQFTSVIEGIRDKEEDKLENLPESLQNGVLGNNISDASDTLTTLLEGADNVSDSCEDILEDAGTDLPKLPVSKPDTVRTDTGPRSHRVQILVSEKMYSLLKNTSLETGRSVNEIINQALLKEIYPVVNK